MLNIPASIQTLFKTDGTRKNFRVHFPNGEMADLTNADVVQESVRFTESLCSQNVFRFGLAEASMIEFETVGVANMYGMTIECSIEISTASLNAGQIAAIQSDPGDGTLVLAADSDLGYGFYRVPYGVFRVESCPRNHGAMTHRRVTGYSADIEDDSLGPLFSLPQVTTSSHIKVNENVIASLLDPSLLVQTSTFEDLSTGSRFYAFFNSSGPSIYVGSGRFYVNNLAYSDNNDGKYNDFVSVNLEYDPDEYYAQGVAFAQSIDAAGYDIRYDSKGKQIYSTTLEALQDRMPFLFYPVVLCDLAYGADSNRNSYEYWCSTAVMPVENNKLMPVVLSSAAQALMNPLSTQKIAFDLSAEKNCYPYRCRLVYVGSYTTADQVNVLCILPNNTTVTLPLQRCAIGAHSGSLYQLSSYSNNAIIINGSKMDTEISTVWDNTSVIKKARLAEYATETGLSLKDIINGYLETRGEFLKQDRSGSSEIVTLDPSAPISISSDDIDKDVGGCWWDEYNVSPIGTVTATYRNGENGETTADFTIGAGASVYDMTENALLKTLADASLSNVFDIVTGDFADNAANAGFTPVDLTMQGWPWMEAGDALEITAEDGAIVDTYALRIEMSGIQHLTADIQSQGGEIIGEE